MKKTIRLTESELSSLIRRVILEDLDTNTQQSSVEKQSSDSCKKLCGLYNQIKSINPRHADETIVFLNTIFKDASPVPYDFNSCHCRSI